MDLIVHQMMQLEVMHVSDGNGSVKQLSGASVANRNLTVRIQRNALPDCPMFAVIPQVFHDITACLCSPLLLKGFHLCGIQGIGHREL